MASPFPIAARAGCPPRCKTILAEMAEDLGVPTPTRGDLSAWAQQGVLLLNTALTVEAGAAGAHLKLGWSALVDEAIAAVSDTADRRWFSCSGGAGRRLADRVDRAKHLVIESGHPSPLNRLRDFKGSRPFSRANRGSPRADWRRSIGGSDSRLRFASINHDGSWCASTRPQTRIQKTEP